MIWVLLYKFAFPAFLTVIKENENNTLAMAVPGTCIRISHLKALSLRQGSRKKEVLRNFAAPYFL